MDGLSADSVGKIHYCRSLVLAAEARKVESASADAQQIPSQPSFIGSEAWNQRLSSKSTFRMPVKLFEVY